MKLVTSALVLMIAAPAAAQYPCPSDPGFCYFDVGNDHCFDPQTDSGPIDEALNSDFPAFGESPDPGSMVCPPSVRNLSTLARSWRTAPGGDVLLYAARLVNRDLLQIESGGAAL